MIASIFSAYRQAYAGLPREVWLLSLALFINRCGSMVLAFLTLFLHEDLGMDKGSAAQMFSVYGAGSLVGTYLGGRLTEHVGAIRLVIILLLLSVPVFLIIPFINSVLGIAVAIFFLAIFSEGGRPPNNTAIAQFSTLEQQPRAFGLQRMALNLGVSFGPAIGGFLAEVDYTWLFIADGLTTMLCGFILLGAFGWKRHSDNSSPKENAASGKHALKSGSPISDFRFIAFLSLLLLTSIVFFQFHATYPLYLTDHYRQTKSDIGLLFSVNTVLIVVFEMLLVDYARRWNFLKVIGWGCALSCIGFGILPFGSLVSFCILSMVIITFGEMLAMPMATTWVAKQSQGKNQGMYMGWYAMTYSLALVIAPLIGGWFYEINKDLFWYISLGFAVVSLIGFYILARSEPMPTEKTSEPNVSEQNAEAESVTSERPSAV